MEKINEYFKGINLENIFKIFLYKKTINFLTVFYFMKMVSKLFFKLFINNYLKNTHKYDPFYIISLPLYNIPNISFYIFHFIILK